MKLTLIEKALLLKRAPLFAELDLDLLLPVCDKMTVMTFEPNQTIFQAGDKGEQMYLVVDGEVRLESSNADPVMVQASHVFGEEALLNECPRTYRATSQTPVTLLTLGQKHLLTILSECPLVALVLLQAYAHALPFRRQPS